MSALIAVFGFVAGAAFSRHRVSITRFVREQWQTPGRKALVLLVAILFVGILLPTDSQPAGRESVAAQNAYRDALTYGLSSKGAQAYGEHVELVLDHAEMDDSFNREMVERGDIDTMPSRSVSVLSLSDYLVRHPQYRRTPQEEASWDPYFRKLVSSGFPAVITCWQ
jgi:hypothetical protein